MKAKKPAGRPKKAEKDKKKAITFKFSQPLLKALDTRSKGKNKTAMVETVLEKEFL